MRLALTEIPDKNKTGTSGTRTGRAAPNEDFGRASSYIIQIDVTKKSK